MAFKLTNDASLDLLRTLGDNKLYYLSNGNEVKEANGWMRFKCFLGIPSARQKVADLVNAVRESLINAAGGNQYGKVNEDSFRNIDQNRLMKGGAIKKIANTFCVANQEKILMAKAAGVAARYADECAAVELFAGAGGLSIGLERAGIHVVIANEIMPDFAATLAANHPDTNVINDDIHSFKEAV